MMQYVLAPDGTRVYLTPDEIAEEDLLLTERDSMTLALDTFTAGHNERIVEWNRKNLAFRDRVLARDAAKSHGGEA